MAATSANAKRSQRAALVMCRMYCEHGWKKDENGCDMCECHECSPIMCMMQCQYGFKKDEKGCSLCACEESCPDVVCKTPCPFGFRKGVNGCDTCQCKETVCEVWTRFLLFLFFWFFLLSEPDQDLHFAVLVSEACACRVLTDFGGSQGLECALGSSCHAEAMPCSEGVCTFKPVCVQEG